MKEIILLKSGEIALKGLNRGSFEDMLIKNCKSALKDLGEFRFLKAQSTTFVEPAGDCDMAEALERLSRVFGIAALCRARVAEKDYAALEEAAAEYLGRELLSARTFKVAAKRSDKRFPLNSPQICEKLGAFLLGRFPHLRVDVESPDVLVTVEIRDFAAYLHGRQIPGAGGIPVSSSGRGMLLLSGGIDSPVAGVMMAKRGLSISAIHFHTPPYTSERALYKVKRLAGIMTRYCGTIPLFIVPFTKISEQIRELCPEQLSTIIMRRFMMRIADRMAQRDDCGALITGESVGQVASQTLPSLACTQEGLSLPVLRPAVGMDKEEIVSLSRKIGAFETSVEPFDDCCVVFTPRHPKTKPKLEEIIRAEEALDQGALILEALDGIEKVLIRNFAGC
ncbi:MAG: tRNA 4-thiouridine(8) synthase ThiI [Oscillospiraceae bacterium]|jgi:thiamine biosynthesis protein ThiI|nr:tRNA 4-thiouridine(8) synthase ThiI [Oscillospiraceae bacterium]